MFFFKSKSCLPIFDDLGCLFTHLGLERLTQPCKHGLTCNDGVAIDLKNQEIGRSVEVRLRGQVTLGLDKSRWDTLG
jgi:hypothetical protein